MRDNEPGEPRRDDDWPNVHDRLRGIRAVIDEYEERVIVGEVYLDDLARVVRYINGGDELHLAHNFVFAKLPWDAAAVRASITQFETLAAPTAWGAWFFENHDHPRVASRYATNATNGQRRARAALMLIGTLRGTPFIYQGGELGLPDARVPSERVVDVDGRDPERAPIPWRRPSASGPGAGFTSGTPWLPIVDDAEHLCVEAEQADPDSMLALARRLLGLRARLGALRAGSQRTIEAAAGAFCFVRESDERVLVAINFTSEPLSLELPRELGTHGTLELSSDPARPTGQLELGSIVLSADEAVIVGLG